MDQTSTFAPITKHVDQDDGSLLVYGKATDDSLDLDEQRCDAGWLKTAMPEWFQWGNIREQHRADSAIGKAIEHDAIEGDGHYITAKIVDPLAIVKTKAGIFTGFSIGIRKPQIVKSPTAPKGLIKGGLITEISLVDRPANSNAILTLCKAAKTGWEGSASDLDQERGLVKCEELLIDEEALAKSMQVTITKGVEIQVDSDSSKADAPDSAGALAGSTTEGCGCCDKCVQPSCGCCDMCGTAPDADGATKTIGEMVVQANTALTPEQLKEYEWIFNREIAESLVKASNPEMQANILAGIQIPPTAPAPEMDDILHAKAAIALIAQLIQAEAVNLATRPYEDCDILLLMQSVQSLRQFICREKMQPGNENSDVQAAVAQLSSSLSMAVDADLGKGKYSAEQLRAMLAKGQAMKNPQGDPSYPIGDREDLSNAIHAVGRGSGDHDAIRSYIKRRAAALGASSMIPDNWSSSGSNKTADSDVVVDTKEKTMADESVEQPSADEVVEDATKTSTEGPDLHKAAGAEVDTDALFKTLKGVVEDPESELHKMFVDIVEATSDTKVKALSEELSAVKALNAELGARLVTVEQMATPGGPPLRRTEVERVNARRSDLEREMTRYKTMASASEDPDLRKGYMQKALQVAAELKSL